MYDANDTTISMPDLDCPAWCARDHARDWAEHVSAAQWSGTIPKIDGTVITVTPSTGYELDEWLQSFAPLHTRSLSDVTLNEYETASISLDRTGRDDATTLYVAAQGAMTAVTARQLAAALLDAADALDVIAS